MLAELKPYPSAPRAVPNEPWLGSVPEHWAVARLKTVVENVADQTADADKSERYIGLEHIESWTGRISAANASAVSGQVKRFQSGDVLFGKLRPYLAKVVRPAFDGVCTGELLVLRPSSPDAYGPYMEHVLRSAGFIHLVNSTTFGARMPRAEWAVVGTIGVPLPPPAEQAGIVRFLGAVDRKVNRFIRAKRRLIEVLTEQKQAIITHAVTRGLPPHDPDAPLKPSGIDWLGDVPKHWEVMRCVRLFRERVERGRAGLPILSVSLNTGVTVSGDVDEDGRPRRLIQDVAQYKYTAKGDIAYNTMRMWQGAVGVVPADGLVSPAYVVAVPRVPLSADYYGLLFRTDRCLQEFNRQSRGIVTDRNRLYWDEFKQVSLPVPPLDEQIAIVAWIADQTREIEQSISAIRREIDLIREYRTRLVADVVTGKLDVRGVPLPDDAEDGPDAAPLADLADEDADQDAAEAGDDADAPVSPLTPEEAEA